MWERVVVYGGGVSVSGWVSAAFEAFSGVHGSASACFATGLGMERWPSGLHYPSALVVVFSVYSCGRCWVFVLCGGFILQQMYVQWIWGQFRTVWAWDSGLGCWRVCALLHYIPLMRVISVGSWSFAIRRRMNLLRPPVIVLLFAVWPEYGYL